MNYFRSIFTNATSRHDKQPPSLDNHSKRLSSKTKRKALPKEFRYALESPQQKGDRWSSTGTKRSIGIARGASGDRDLNLGDLNHFLRTTGPKRDKVATASKVPHVFMIPASPTSTALPECTIRVSSSLTGVNEATEALTEVVTSMMRNSTGSFLTMGSLRKDKEQSTTEDNMGEFQYMTSMIASPVVSERDPADNATSSTRGSPRSDQETLRQSLDDKPLPSIPLSEYMDSPSSTLCQIQVTLPMYSPSISSLHNQSGSVRFRLPTRTVPRPKATTYSRGELKEETGYAQWYHTATTRAKEKLTRKKKERQPISKALISLFGDGISEDLTEFGQLTTN